jgi:hypothetical protein
MSQEIRWHLELGGELIARISDLHSYEFPWTYGELVDSPKFERFRVYFNDPETWPEDDPEIEKLCGEVHVRGGFLLKDRWTGLEYREITLNHDNDVGVWFRIS